MKAQYEQRIAQLAAKLEADGLDAYLAHHPVSLGYLTGFAEDAHERFLALAVSSSGQTALILPALSAAQARRNGLSNLMPWKDGESPTELFAQLAETWDLEGALIAVDDFMPSKMLLEMQDVLPRALFKPGGEILGALMQTKDQSELESMMKAGKIADESYAALLEFIRPGMSEIEVRDFLVEQMKKRGGEPTFCVAAFGPNSAEPHHAVDATVLKSGQIALVDFGCLVDGYNSDITRTLCVGPASDRMKEIYETVYRAHMAARSVGKSGVSGAEVDAAARSTIEAAGYGEFFTHRTGHGIGMQVHEEPYISAANGVGLPLHSCFSIEPGIYLENEFGVRIENIYFAKEDGLESFNQDPSPVLKEVLTSG